MKGVNVKATGDMYLISFDSYTAMVSYINQKRPSQMGFAFDGETLTASIPVAAYTVRPENEVKENETPVDNT